MALGSVLRMKKITTLFTAVALATTLGLAGCKKDKKDEAPAPAPSPTDSTKPVDPAVKPTDPAVTPTDPAVKPADPAVAPTDPAAAGSTGMTECDEYLKVVEAYSKCDKVPQPARDAAIKSRDTAKATWTGTMTDDAKKAAAAGCKSGSDTLKTGAQTMGCAI
jgi:hypothetical protein